MKIYILYNTDRADNEARIVAVVSDMKLAAHWDRYDGHHHDEFELDETSTIAWALKKDKGW